MFLQFKLLHFYCMLYTDEGFSFLTSVNMPYLLIGRKTEKAISLLIYPQNIEETILNEAVPLCCRSIRLSQHRELAEWRERERQLIKELQFLS